MKKKNAGKIAGNYFNTIIEYINRPSKRFEKESIHSFRVTVKKLRAFLRMMRLEAKDPGELKFSPEFKKMYAFTGRIRDKQLLMEYLRENRLLKQAALINKETDELKKSNAFLTKDQVKKTEEKIKQSLPDHAGPHLVKKFTKKKREDIKKIIEKGNYSDPRLHEIRKRIKDITYITGIFKTGIKKDKLKKAEKLAQMLGQYNDIRSKLSFINPAMIKKETEDKDQLRALRKKWLAEKRTLKKEILHELPSISSILQ